MDHDVGFSLPVPTEWEYVDRPAAEVRFVVVEPLADQRFRNIVVVTADDLSDGLGLAEWPQPTGRLPREDELLDLSAPA